MISSQSNSKVKYVRHLQRDRRFRAREKAFVVEGSRWFRELLVTSELIKWVFYTDTWSETAVTAAELPAQSFLVDEAVMASMSATETPPGILAVATQPSLPLPSPLSFALICDRVTDPGNLGTLLRTGGAAGVEAVFLSPGCVDSYNPKVVRSSMGAHLRLSIRQWEWTQIKTAVADMQVLLAVVADGEMYTAVDWQNPSALIIGSEAHGVGPIATQIATERITIPMHAHTESLNAAMAAGVILFEAVRQRQEIKVRGL